MSAWVNPWFHDYMARAVLSMPPPGQRLEAVATHETIKGYSCVVENHGTYATCAGCAPKGSRGGFHWRQDLNPESADPVQAELFPPL